MNGGIHEPPDRTNWSPTIDTLNPKQRALLRAMAHELKPVLNIGKEGVTESALAALVQAFATRELLKLKVLEAAPVSARETATALEAIEGVQIVQVIGRTVVLYRRHPERPKLELPKR